MSKVIKSVLQILFSATLIITVASCEDNGPGSVNSVSDLNGVWKTTDVSGTTPDEIDYLVVENARWGFLTNGSSYNYSQATTIAGDGSGEFYLSNGLGTMYLEEYSGDKLTMTHKGVTRTYKLDKNATTATIYNKSNTTYNIYVYEKDRNGDNLYYVSAGSIMAGNGWRGPFCVYTETLYVDVYDSKGNFVNSYYWSDLANGSDYDLELQ